MCKNPRSPYMVIFAAPRPVVIKLDCRSYTCEECGKKRSQAHYTRISEGVRELLENELPMAFVTLTSNRKLKTYETTKRVFPKAWAKLSRRWKREQGGLCYVMVFERHKDGRLHCHMLTQCFVSQRWLKDNAAECGLGYQCKVDYLNGMEEEDLGKAIGYVTKYTVKGLGDKYNSGRTVNYSRDFPQSHDDSKKRINAKHVDKGVYKTLTEVIGVLMSMGVHTVVNVDGEVVDTLDLSD